MASWFREMFSNPNATQPAPRGIGPQGQSLMSSFKESAAPVGELFQNPNFLKFLADTGAAVDPEGAGGMIGQPTSQWIERKQMGEALGQQNKVGNEQFERLLQMLSGSSNLTGIKIDPKGGIEFKGATGESSVSQGEGGTKSAASGSEEQPGLNKSFLESGEQA